MPDDDDTTMADGPRHPDERCAVYAAAPETSCAMSVDLAGESTRNSVCSPSVTRPRDCDVRVRRAVMDALYTKRASPVDGRREGPVDGIGTSCVSDKDVDSESCDTDADTRSTASARGSAGGGEGVG